MPFYYFYMDYWSDKMSLFERREVLKEFDRNVNLMILSRANLDKECKFECAVYWAVECIQKWGATYRTVELAKNLMDRLITIQDIIKSPYDYKEMPYKDLFCYFLIKLCEVSREKNMMIEVKQYKFYVSLDGDSIFGRKGAWIRKLVKGRVGERMNESCNKYFGVNGPNFTVYDDGRVIDDDLHSRLAELNLKRYLFVFIG